ncbi:MAG: hypothetical protein ACREJM_02120 [Candidatus Saccharimonadales bacterium]
MKWLKRLALLVVFLAVFAGALGAAGWWLTRRPPDWYAHRQANPREMAQAASRAEREVQRTLSWAQDQQAYSVSSDTGTPSTKPARSLQISLTQDELNGFFQKWDSTFGWSRRYGSYLSDPQIVIRDDRLILAATVKDTGSVLSVEFSPRLEDGKLQMPLERVLAGRLPLPQAFWDRYRQGLESAIDARLPDWEQGADITPAGAANSDAVAAAMSELLLDVLAARPAKPVLFLPYSVGNNPRSFPVKLTSVQIADKTLTLTMEPMTPPERHALLDSIRTTRVAQISAQSPSGVARQ